jgi:hypothetical protein
MTTAAIPTAAAEIKPCIVAEAVVEPGACERPERHAEARCHGRHAQYAAHDARIEIAAHEHSIERHHAAMSRADNDGKYIR